MPKRGKLLGRIKELLGSNNQFAKELGIDKATLSMKINGHRSFTEAEIRKAVKILNLKLSDIPDYFFK